MSKVRQIIREMIRRELKEYGPRNRRPKQGASGEEQAYISMASRSGLRPEAIRKFVEENGIDYLKLVMDVGQGKLSGKDLATAIVGTPGNHYTREIIAKYAQ